MRRFVLLGLGLAALFLAFWGLLVVLEVGWVVRLPRDLERGGWVGGALGVTLLAADVVLPVPSSLWMFGLGRLYGLWLGAGLSLFGSTLSGWLAWELGRRGEARLARWMSAEERRAADAWLARHGLFVLALSRPVPILAETLALLAGARSFSRGSVVAASALGILPAALAYAWAGSRLEEPREGLVLFAATLGLAGALWILGRRLRGGTRG